jgi:hypothetical protein
MNKGNVHMGALTSHNEACNCPIFSKIDGTGDHHIKYNKLDIEKQVSHVLACV